MLKLILAFALSFNSALALALSPAPTHSHSDSHRVVRQTETTDLPARGEYARKTLLTPSEFAPASELQMTSYTFEKIAESLVGTLDQTTNFRVLVRSSDDAQFLIRSFKDLGGDVSRLRPQVTQYDSMWFQDYGPIYSVDQTGALVVNDFNYNRYGRVNDDKIPKVIASVDQTPHRQVTMNYEGGNFISDGLGNCFASSRMYEQNEKLSQSQVNALMKANLGCEKMIVLTPLEDDITYHIDLFAKLVDANTFLVGDFIDQPNNRKLMDENARILQSLGYTVLRTPVRSTSSSNHRTHINSFIINGYVLMPTYNIPEDDTAAATYEKLGFKVLRIDSRDLEYNGGALHCIMRSKPNR